MKLCPFCKVYLSDEPDHCPLCGQPVQDETKTVSRGIPEAPAGIRHESEPERAGELSDRTEQLTPREKRRLAVELISVSLGIILIITCGIDFIFSRDITWSRYTGLSLAILWFVSAIPLILRGYPAFVLAVLGPVLLLAVLFWSLVSGDLGWYLPLGLPVSLSVEIAVVSSYVLIAVQNRHGLNSVGVLLCAGVFVCAVIDGAVCFFITGYLKLTWSIVVCISAIPVAGLFYYLHYRVTNRASLRKLFRL